MRDDTKTERIVEVRTRNSNLTVFVFCVLAYHVGYWVDHWAHRHKYETQLEDERKTFNEKLKEIEETKEVILISPDCEFEPSSPGFNTYTVLKEPI